LLIDVSAVPLERLRAIDDSQLAHAIRRVLREAKENPGVLAAFQNRILSPEEAGEGA
jgi:FXSXX-COOH protein